MTARPLFDTNASTKLEAVYRTPDVVTQRQATLHALALRPKDRALDVGAGPGFLVAEMAEQVGPRGHVTGLDISDSMAALAQRLRLGRDDPTVTPGLASGDGGSSPRRARSAR